MDEQNTGANMGPNMQDMQTQPAQETHEHHHGARGIVWSIVVLVVLVLVVWGLMQFTSPGNEIGDGQYLNTADVGEVIAGFPKEFIIEFDTLEDGQEVPKAAESYKVTYRNEGVELLVLRYMSDISFFDNKIAFANVFSEGGWAVSIAPGDELAVGGTESFQARRGGERVEVVLNDTGNTDGGGLEVTISYSRAL